MNFNTTHIKVKDHSVSGEEFQLLLDTELQLLKTTPQPAPENLGKYYESEDYISHTDSKRSLFERLYHAIKQKALRDKVQLITRLTGTKGNLLDIGAGTGDFAAEAAKGGWSVTGFEPSEKARAIAKSKGVALVNDTAELPDASFDVITMWHVLEHVPNVEKQIAELKRLVKPGGHIIIAVPNFKSFDAKYYGQFWAAYDVPRHLWHFSKMAIEKLFAAQGIKLVKILPMKFDSFYVSLLSEKYKTGKMSFAKGFITGMRSNLKGKSSGEYSSHIYVLKR
ncbi:MAG: class I SAM-dependent methyltransferase [Flavobacterium sp.]